MKMKNEEITKKWNTKCKRMKWTDNKIGDEGAMKISESLMTNTTLTILDLSCDDNIIKNIKIMKNRFLNIFMNRQ
jgi:hypothetical protein